MIDLKIKRLHPDAVIPQYATTGSACFDLHAIEDAYLDDIGHVNEIIPTGLAFEVPVGYVMLIYIRSSLAFKNDVRLANCVGVIDSDYRGELKIKLAVDLGGMAKINKGDRVAQAMLVEVPQVSIVEVDELSETMRGDGGFGSTGL